MTEQLFVVSAEFWHLESDGINHNDGAELDRLVKSNATWVFGKDATIEEIMDKVSRERPPRLRSETICLTQDSVSRDLIVQEQAQASRVRREAEEAKHRASD